MSTDKKALRNALPYRDCVGIALFNPGGEVFIARRIFTPGPDTSEVDQPWQMPQGGIDPGEDPLAAAHRELYEETSVRSVSLLGAIDDWIFYDLPDEALGLALKGRYRGQRQKWFAFLLTGAETEIDLEAPGSGPIDPEFDAWRWADFSTVHDIIVPFKRPAYLAVQKGFGHIPARLAAGERP